jgi:hypothetical protein
MKYFETDLPARLLDLFELRSGAVHWVKERPMSAVAKKLAPWGERAGGLAVIGHGSIVSVSGARLLSCDIAFALEHAGEWPWQCGSFVPFEPVVPRVIGLAKALARERWRLKDGEVVWSTTRGDRALEGQQAKGQAMSGFRCPVIATNATAFLYDDVKHLLTIGSFPFETDWD